MSRISQAEDADVVRNATGSVRAGWGFEVLAVANVRGSLAENFAVLLSDLHTPHTSDGFTVVSAMRHTHPTAVRLVLSGYSERDEAPFAYRLTKSWQNLEIASHREIIPNQIANPSFHRPCPRKPWRTYWNMISARSGSMYAISETKWIRNGSRPCSAMSNPIPGRGEALLRAAVS